MKAYIVTLGCPKNLVDSEAAAAVLRDAGCGLTGDPREADVLLVGACSFLESAWRETVGEVDRLAAYKAGSSDKRLVLMGCLPRHRDLDLERALPAVDHFLPAGAHARLAGLVTAWSSGGAPRAVAGGTDPFAAYERRDVMTPPHTAYVKVAEGCNRSCAFCAIPVIRGRQRTRPLDAIVREVEGHVARGAREVNLLAQDIVSWREGPLRFPDLVAAVADTGVDWVRLYYVHPAGLDVETVSRLFDHPAVVRYLEMPVQHAASRMLRAMRRGHDRAHLERLIDGARAAVPGLVIRSEVIVGFPGESEREFVELRNFLERFEFDSLGIFPYSREPGTEAATLADAVDPATIRARTEELTAAQEAVSFGARHRFAGRRLRVLVDRVLDGDDGVFDGCRYAGRFYGQALGVDGEVYVEADELPVGEFVDVDVTECGVFDLQGVPAVPVAPDPPLLRED